MGRPTARRVHGRVVHGRDFGAGPVFPEPGSAQQFLNLHCIRHRFQSTMASETEPEPVPQAAATGNKPPLVCAPCWICLEDGPDEAGEPLIRVCACRGETSAGYHLSCIIEYAKRKSQRFINMGEAPGIMSTLENPYPDLLDHWRVCPNCKQFYEKGVGLKLAEAYVDMTENLPETRVVRYEARFLLIEKRVAADVDLHLAVNEIIELFQLVRANAGRMANNYYGHSGGIFNKTFVEGERERLCSSFAHIEMSRGNLQNAFQLQERAVEACRYLVRRGASSEESLARIEGELKFMKAMSGQKMANREADLREELAHHLSGDNSYDALMVILCKKKLAIELTERERPDFVEGIELLEDVLGLFGPNHESTLYEKERLETMKKEYRNYSSENNHETP